MIPVWEQAPTGASAERAARLAALLPQIETERLTLRAPRIGDFDAYAGVMAIERRADRALLGFAILNHEYGDPEPELGWALTETAEGQGYATEAARSLRDHAGRMGLTELVSYIDPANSRSAAVARRLGARRDRALFDGSEVWRHAAAGASGPCRDGYPTQAIRETDEGKTR